MFKRSTNITLVATRKVKSADALPYRHISVRLCPTSHGTTLNARSVTLIIPL